MKTKPDEPTKRELRAARAAFRKTLRELMRNCAQHALASLDKAQGGGADPLGAYISDGSPYRIPKNFLSAVLLDLAAPRGFGPLREDKRGRAMVKNFGYFI